MKSAVKNSGPGALKEQVEFDWIPPPLDASVETVIAVLAQETAWITAAELLANLHEKPTDANKRKLRDLASQSQGQIISGQKGYRHIRHATPDETIHAANWLEHQAKEMALRATQIRRTFHQLPHTPKS